MFVLIFQISSYKIWHYSGALLYERPWNKQEELWEVSWQTFPEGYFKKPTVSFKHIEGIQSTVPTGKICVFFVEYFQVR